MRHRERATWRDGYVVAVFVGFLAYCVGPSLVGLRTLISVNLLSNFYPWVANHGSDLSGHNACGGDTIDAGLPGIAHIRSQLLTGHLANWQSVVAGGGALAGVPNLGLLDPLSLPYWILPLWLAPAFVILLQILAGAGGTYLFMRQFRISRAAALLAGLVFATSGFMVVWSNWPQTRVAALIPALFWSVERLVQRRRLRDIALIAVVVASMLLGGFPAVTGYALYMVTGYLIVRVLVVHRAELWSGLRTVALAGAGLVLGASLAMVQLLPFIHLYSSANLAYRSGNAKAGLPLSGLLTLFAPNAYGLCVFGRPNHGSTNPVELVAYVGAAALVLAIAGAAFGPARERILGMRGITGYFVAACTLIILLCWVSPTMRSVVAGLPAFAGNFIGRIRSVLGFGLAVLAGIGFDWLMSPDRERLRTAAWRRARVWAAVVVTACLAAGIVILRDAHRAAFSGGYAADLRNALLVPGILLAGAASVVVIARLGGANARNFAFLVIPLLVAGQAAQFFHTVLPGDDPSDFYPDTATHQYLAAHLGDDRFASSGRTMYTATALYYDLRTPTGHAFHETAWEDLLKAVDPAAMSTPTFSDFTPALNQSTIADQPILDQMGVKYFVLPPSDLAGRPEPLPAADGTISPHGAVGEFAGAVDCSLSSQPVRGITFALSGPLTSTGTKSDVTLDLLLRDGPITLTSGAYLGRGLPSGSQVTIPVAGESLPVGNGPMTVSLRARGAREPLAVAARSGAAVCAPVLPVSDGLRLVFADAGSVIYQRMTALPRIRWASRTVTLEDPGARVAALKGGLPSDEVILNSRGPGASGQPATVGILDDSDGAIAARVAARGGGYLVVADAMQQQGWSVTLDGRKAALVPVDNAMVAVYVPAGAHTVRFSYSTPGQEAGLVVSTVALLVLLAVVIAPRTRVADRWKATRANRTRIDR
jgi:hypothetical protein